MSTFNYGEDHLTTGIALGIARGQIQGVISETSRNRIRQSSQVVANIANGDKAVYGINTGFGPLCTTQISKEETRTLQQNILMSHAVGVGDPIPDEVAKLMLILKVHALSRGFSGVQEATLDRIIWHIDNDAIPVVPSQGSVGASGDLAPLAHLFLPLIGMGSVRYQEEILTGEAFLKHAKLNSVTLGAKEGLGLINGTQFIASFAVLVVDKLQNVLANADVIGAMMIEGMMGSLKPFAEELHELRAYKGNSHVATIVRTLLDQSEIVVSHANCTRVQDPYSLRCIPQVHGTSRNTWLHLKELVEIELNSVTDNPIVFNEEHTISGGNFHGQPLALPLDYACIAASEIGNISDRRTYLSLEGDTPGVPKLLLKDTGTNSGFMMVQYTAAALASENKSLCFPSGADSIPTGAGQEDHVSMGSISGRKALQVIQNVEKILGLELFCAAQAMDFHAPLKSGKAMQAIHKHVRKVILHIEKDQTMQKEIESAIELVQSKQLIKIAKETVNLSTPYHSEFEEY